MWCMATEKSVIVSASGSVHNTASPRVVALGQLQLLRFRFLSLTLLFVYFRWARL